MDIRPDQPDFRRNERLRERRGEPTRSGGSERPQARETDETNPRIQAARAKSVRVENARLENAAADSESDRIDLSEGARAAERLTEGGTPADRLAALRELYQSGKLNSLERLEIAAARILGKQVD